MKKIGARVRIHNSNYFDRGSNGDEGGEIVDIDKNGQCAVKLDSGVVIDQVDYFDKDPELVHSCMYYKCYPE